MRFVKQELDKLKKKLKKYHESGRIWLREYQKCTLYLIQQKTNHYKLATNQSLNLSPRVSTRGLSFLLTAGLTDTIHHNFYV